MRAASQVGGIRVVGVMETSNYDLLEAFLGGESPKRGNGGEFNESLHFIGERIQLFRKEHNVELVRKTERRKEALPDRGILFRRFMVLLGDIYETISTHGKWKFCYTAS